MHADTNERFKNGRLDFILLNRVDLAHILEDVGQMYVLHYVVRCTVFHYITSLFSLDCYKSHVRICLLPPVISTFKSLLSEQSVSYIVQGLTILYFAKSPISNKMAWLSYSK